MNKKILFVCWLLVYIIAAAFIDQIIVPSGAKLVYWMLVFFIAGANINSLWRRIKV